MGLWEFVRSQSLATLYKAVGLLWLVVFVGANLADLRKE